MTQDKKLTFSVKTTLLITGAAVGVVSALGCVQVTGTSNPAPVNNISTPSQDMGPDQGGDMGADQGDSTGDNVG